MNLGSYLTQRIALLPYLFVALIITFTLHEFAHALVAKWLGDDYPEQEGRLSLNPLRQIDIKGLLLMIVIGIGWSKPTPLYEENYRSSSDYILSVIAGPIMNLILAIIGVFLLPLAGIMIPYALESWGNPDTYPLIQTIGLILIQFLQIFVQINLFFLIFNLLPLPGLDGFKLWGHLLGNPSWFYNFFMNPMVTLLIFAAIVSNILPIGVWAMLLMKGLLSFSLKVIYFFLI